MAYTPGPWEQSASLIYSPSSEAMICELSEPHGSKWVKHSPVSISSPDWDQAMDNASLITAAPDLLEALLAIRDAIEAGELVWKHRRQADSDPYHPANVKLTAAIAKAEK